MDTSESLDHVVAQTHTLATWVSGQDGGLPVPTCPEWTLADLVQHVGATQRMVTMLVAERMTEPSQAFAREVSAPTDPSEWGPWLTRTATEAQEAFGSVTDDTPVWDPSGDSAGVPFWSRRLFGEISVHRADAAATLDLPYELAPEAAVAALVDWLDTLTSRGYWHNRVGFAEAMRGAGQTLHFHATDAPGEWLARREPDRVALERSLPRRRHPERPGRSAPARHQPTSPPRGSEHPRCRGRPAAAHPLHRPHGLGHRLIIPGPEGLRGTGRCWRSWRSSVRARCLPWS